MSCVHRRYPVERPKCRAWWQKAWQIVPSPKGLASGTHRGSASKPCYVEAEFVFPGRSGAICCAESSGRPIDGSIREERIQSADPWNAFGVSITDSSTT